MFVVWRSLIKAWLCEQDSNRLLQLLAHVELRMQKDEKKSRKKEEEKEGDGDGMGKRRKKEEGGGGGGEWETLRRLLAFSLPFKCLND